MDPMPRGPAAVFDWIWRTFEVIEWHALERGSPPLLDAAEHLQHLLVQLETAFCERRRPDRRGPLLGWAFQHAATLDRVLRAEAGDHGPPLEALARLSSAFGALEDLLEIEARWSPRPPAVGDE